MRHKLKGAIVAAYGTETAFASKMGISRQAVSNVIVGRSTPSYKRMLEWCEMLGIDPAEIGVFFAHNPQKTVEA